jgi:hypothetical protein
LQNAKRLAEKLEVPLRVLDIQDPTQEEIADRLIKEHGDWAEDYLIPQVFVEYTDERVDHILTGFSEAVTVTEASWEAFFSSDYYKNLIRDRRPMKRFVKNHLIFKGHCRRHCEKPVSFLELWSNSEEVVGAYACPDGYVSRVIYFSVNPDLEWYTSFLSSQVGKDVVKDRDIRPASRHGWELDPNALAEISDMTPTGTVKEVYWTIYPQTEIEKHRGVFLCHDTKGNQGCGKLFVQDRTSRNRLCSNCSR